MAYLHNRVAESHEILSENSDCVSLSFGLSILFSFGIASLFME